MNYEKLIKKLRERMNFIAEASLEDDKLNTEFVQLQIAISAIHKILKEKK